jgi:aryl-alcohol dehydrogenase-like predicted oxidoreductase
MEQRRLGSTREVVPAIGLGGAALAGSYHKIDVADAVRLVHRAIELGVNHVDMSDLYGWGRGEEILGRAVAGRRDEVFIATKFGQLMADDGKTRIVRGDAPYVRECIDRSLARLGVDHVDLYYAHRIDPKVPIEETVGAMAELVEAGKVRNLGVCEAAPGTIRRAHAVHPLAAVQAEYSLWTRFAEDEIFGVCEELGIGYVAFSPIGRGFLSGEIKGEDDIGEGDLRRIHPRFRQENIDRNIELVQAITDVAVAHGISNAQVALAWVLAQREFLIPIPGTTSARHLEENVAAVEVVLPDDDLARLGEAFDPALVAGDRMPAYAMEKLQK